MKMDKVTRILKETILRPSQLGMKMSKNEKKKQIKCETNNTSGIVKHIDTYWDRQTTFEPLYDLGLFRHGVHY